MVNEGILGGLKLALSKGESLKQAMMTFYNAGYKKEEIEEAARVLQKESTEAAIQQKSKESLKQERIQKSSKPKKQIKAPAQKVSAYGEQTKIKPPLKKEISVASEKPKKEKVVEKPKKAVSQKISSYEKQKPKGKLIIFLLIFSLLFLVGALIAVFLFKQELVDFFNKLS